MKSQVYWYFLYGNYCICIQLQFTSLMNTNHDTAFNNTVTCLIHCMRETYLGKTIELYGGKS